MLTKSDLEKMSLRSLRDLMTIKIDELIAIRNIYGDYAEQKKDIELVLQVINDKNAKPVNE